MRLIVVLLILSLAGLAAVVSFKAKPAGATGIVCNPMLVPNAKQQARIVRA